MVQVEALCAAQSAFRVAPLELAHVTALPDPFGGMAVATARACRVPLVTADASVHDSALVDTIWETDYANHHTTPREEATIKGTVCRGMPG